MSSFGGTGVEGATSMGARLGSLCDKDDGTKIASQSSLVPSDM